MKAITADWVSLEDEEDDEGGGNFSETEIFELF